MNQEKIHKIILNKIQFSSNQKFAIESFIVKHLEIANEFSTFFRMLRARRW